MNENPKKSNDKRKRGGAEKVGQSGIGRKSLPLIVISFFFNLNLPHFQISFLIVYHSLISDNIKSPLVWQEIEWNPLIKSEK